MRKIGFYLLVGFYILAGVNHFVNPSFYIPLIPPYFVFPEGINYLSGAIEIILGVLLIPEKTRLMSTYFLVAMLLAFIPSHIWMIQAGGCFEGSLCVPVWVGWVRLIIVHPLLIWWVLAYRNYLSKYDRNFSV
ncbi:MAG: hypothetical protein AAF363_17225 [Bacteroidota bacterium]